jgi:hypothetical protein
MKLIDFRKKLLKVILKSQGHSEYFLDRNFKFSFIWNFVRTKIPEGHLKRLRLIRPCALITISVFTLFWTDVNGMLQK